MDVDPIETGLRRVRCCAVEGGKLEGLTLVSGNPLEDLDLVADTEKNFAVIMKDGVIYSKNIK